MKKLEDAMRRFGTPDHGRTAKRLRDFEAQLDAKSNGDFDHARIHQALIDGIMMQPDKPWPRDHFDKFNAAMECKPGSVSVEGLTLGQSCMANAFELDEMNKAPIGEARDKVISRQYAVIKSLQVLLNQKDEEIDMLRSAPPVRARDLWIAAGLVSLVLLSAYYGFM